MKCAYLYYGGDSQAESEGDLHDARGAVPGSDAAASNQHEEERAQELCGQHPPNVAVIRNVV